MRNVTLEALFNSPVARKYLERSGVAHAVQVAEYAFQFAVQQGVDVDLATKAALLHDVGHYNWYRDGEWDYDAYRENDIHAIKGAGRAHQLLIEMGEDRQNAKEIAIAILLHTDSYLPSGGLQLTPLQRIVKLADEADEEKGGKHHEKLIYMNEAIARIKALDERVEEQLKDPDKRAKYFA